MARIDNIGRLPFAMQQSRLETCKLFMAAAEEHMIDVATLRCYFNDASHFPVDEPTAAAGFDNSKQPPAAGAKKK